MSIVVALNISSTRDFNLVDVLAQDLLLQSFLKVTAPCNWLIFFITFYTI